VPIAAAILFAACSGAADPPGPASGVAAPSSERPSAAAPIRLALDVHRSPGCSCCHVWEAYLQAAGWSVRAADDPEIATLKTRHGIPEEAWSCHTALVAGYVIEGHVPIEAIEDLLAQRPAIDGIALPGMPAGSAGMPGPKAGPFEVLAVRDGATTLFGLY
jgi:hypothetical protein